MKLDNFKMNLQLFAQEKTEKATPRRRQEARKKGQVVKSRELNSALILLMMTIVLRYTLPRKVTDFISFSKSIFIDYTVKNDLYSPVNLISFSKLILLQFTFFLLPIIGTAFIAGLIVNYIQVGFVFTTDSISFRLDRLNPVEGFKRIFSKRALVELLKSFVKIFVVTYVVYSVLKNQVKAIPILTDMDIRASIAYIGNLVFDVVVKSGIAILILSILDYLYQWWEYEQNLRMSKEDIKEEFKQTEGNPQIKSRIKQVQRQMAMRRMMQEIPKADVVITNPIHLAVAIKYDSEKHHAPVVVAKGANIIAEKIKEIAKINNIIILENKPLAQILYKDVDIGEAIPESLYHAVAEVLAFVYSLKQQGG